MNFWNKFCGLVFLLLISSAVSFSQNTLLSAYSTNFRLKIRQDMPRTFVHFTPPQAFISGLETVKPVVPANFYASNLGFFCKKELLLEKASKIPFRFRLGSLQQCNYYEGKKQY